MERIVRIFVTGATSVLGRATIQELVSHGHSVSGLARTDASRAMLHAMQVVPVAGQGHDADALAEALYGMDAILHLATGLPATPDAVEDRWPQRDEVIVGMLRTLLAASEMDAVRTVVFPSFCAVYGDHGDEWVDERAALNDNPYALPYLEAENLLLDSTDAGRSVGVVLRMGLLYGPDSPSTHGLLYAIKRGQAPILSGGQMYWPMIHMADAAQALRLAAEQSPGGAIFNVCDDQPVRQSILYESLAEQLGAPPPQSVIAAQTGDLRAGLLNPFKGYVKLESLQLSIRMVNEALKMYLGMRLRYPTWEEGFYDTLKQVQTV